MRLPRVGKRPLFCLLLSVMLPACGLTPVKPDPATGVDSPAAINAQLGLSYMQHGNYDVAEAKLLKALQQDPDMASAHHYIAELYRQRDETALASRHYKRALELNPDDTRLQHNFGVFLCEQKEYDEAVRRFLIAARDRHYSRPAEAWLNAGLCMMRKPDYAQAERYLRKALAFDNRQAAALYQMARVSLHNRQYLKARAFLQRYSAVARHTADSLWLGVQIERALGDRQAAAGYVESLERLFPGAEQTLRSREVSSVENDDHENPAQH